MLYQTSLCFTMLPYALPDLSVLNNASLCFTRPLCALQCFPMLYQTSLCFTMLPYALPELSVLYNASLCFTRPLCALQCLPVLQHACAVLSHTVLWESLIRAVCCASCTLTGVASARILPQDTASSGHAPESEPLNSCPVFTKTERERERKRERERERGKALEYQIERSYGSIVFICIFSSPQSSAPAASGQEWASASPQTDSNYYWGPAGSRSC